MKRVIWIWAVFLLVIVAGCRLQPDNFVAKGALDFDTDTVFFDTIFTTLPSPTSRLVVRNNSGKNMLISEIKFETGEEYTMIFDGITANRVENYELADGDSAVAFIKFTSTKKDEFSRDRLLFTVGNNTQKVEIEAFVWDAIFYRDSVLGGFGSSNLTVMGPDKKHLIDGQLYVAEGHTLRILPGTQLYFTSRKDAGFNLISSIVVFGRLLVEGAQGNEVVFQQTRLGERYDESGGQWRGIAFADIAKASKIDHAIIKNGLIGVYLQGGNVGVSPKVHITNSEIRSMGAYGILALSYMPSLPNYPQLLVENTLIHNSVNANVGLYGGGKCDFRHTTLANYTVDFTRRSPQLAINNYDTIAIYPTQVSFENCLVWGSEEEEFEADSFPIANAYDVTFSTCVVRTTLPLKGFNTLTANSLDFPKFKDPTAGRANERDYHLTMGSPAIDLGNPISGLTRDKEGKPHIVKPDAGCYEFSE